MNEFLLYNLVSILERDAVGLYRGDGLGVFCNTSGIDANVMKNKVNKFL